MAPTIASQAVRPQTPSTSWRLSLWSVTRFGLLVALTSLALSLFAIPWTDDGSWWIAIRRCVSIGAALSVWFAITKLERRSLRSYGFSGGREGTRQFLFGLYVGVGALLAILVVGLAIGVCRISISPNHVKVWRTLIGFIPAAVIVGVLEELVFRGFILQQLLAWSRPFAIVISSALYAVVHLKVAVWELSAAFELFGLFLLGVLLSVSYLKTNQLYCSVGLHASLAYGARINKLVIGFDESAASWLVGTSRLVNGFANWVVLFLIGGIVLWRLRRLEAVPALPANRARRDGAVGRNGDNLVSVTLVSDTEPHALDDQRLASQPSGVRP